MITYERSFLKSAKLLSAIHKPVTVLLEKAFRKAKREKKIHCSLNLNEYITESLTSVKHCLIEHTSR